MEERISRTAHAIRPSVIREMALKAQRMEDVISFGIREPDFNTSSEVCRHALEDALRGATHYTPSQSDPELLEALCAHLKHRYDYDLHAENIVVTPGGTGALTAFFRTILNPGQEVLVPKPCFPPYRPQIEWAGGTVVEIPTGFDHEFTLSAEAVKRHITPQSNVPFMNYPHNLTGSVIPSSNLDELALLARKRDLLVLSDEVYDRFLFDGVRHESPATRPEMSNRTLVVGSFSKSFSMTGWRLGYAHGPQQNRCVLAPYLLAGFLPPDIVSPVEG